MTSVQNPINVPAANLNITPGGGRRRLTRCAGMVAAIAIVAASVSAGASPQRENEVVTAEASDSTPVAASESVASTSRYIPIAPTRVVDTRSALGVPNNLAAGDNVIVDPLTAAVLGVAGVQRGSVSAVVLNLTVADTTGAGWAALWPAGTEWPGTSSINITSDGQILANMVTVPVGTEGKLSLTSTVGTAIIIDVEGVYTPATQARAGRYVPVPPTRAIDTRSDSGPLASGSTRTFDLTKTGVPATARAAVLNITVTDTASAGFVTVWNPTLDRPTASSLNTDSAQETRANQVIADLSGGRVNVFASMATNVIIDVSGYFTGSSESQSDAGLFTPVNPVRILDTRNSGNRVSAGGVTTANPIAASLIDATATVAVVNITLTDPLGPGYLTAYPAGQARPNVSNLNAMTAGDTVANHAIVSLGATGITVYSQPSTHFVIDVTGYFTKTTLPPAPPAPPVPPAPQQSNDYSFLFGTKPDGTPRNTWNPCKAIKYRVFAGGASQAQLAAMNRAINTLALVTGFTFTYVGPYDDSQYPNAQGADAIIEYFPIGEPRLEGAIGVGGGSATAGWFLSGHAFLSTSITAEPDMTNLVLHELGHMVGLGHAQQFNNVMYPIQVNYFDNHGVRITPYKAYGPGDLAGLSLLSARKSCTGTTGTRAPSVISPSGQQETQAASPAAIATTVGRSPG